SFFQQIMAQARAVSRSLHLMRPKPIEQAVNEWVIWRFRLPSFGRRIVDGKIPHHCVNDPLYSGIMAVIGKVPIPASDSNRWMNIPLGRPAVREFLINSPN